MELRGPSPRAVGAGALVAGAVSAGVAVGGGIPRRVPSAAVVEQAGNLFGPVFGACPNLITMRGDKPRSVVEYLKSPPTRANPADRPTGTTTAAASAPSIRPL